MLDIIKNDPWLAPFSNAVEGRHNYFLQRHTDLTQGGKITLSDFATGHLWFGLQKRAEGWVFREWAPNATEIFLIGTFNGWQRQEAYRLRRREDGVWEVRLPAERIHHQDLYKLHVSWEGGSGERIPAWCKRVVQDEQTFIFSAQVWEPEERYMFRHSGFKPDTSPLLIYETHVGMSTEEEKVGSYSEFREKILPRVKENGYNTIQIMAIQEHPYYGSFGYHVSSFFAPSSRNGTPEELRELIDTAHGMGIAVIMDIVHSHAVKNETEGIARMDGTHDLYFHRDPERRNHKAWDSLCFDYRKDEVLHFLLSNCKYWLEEYKFDGFRFDGVTSMIYRSHGLEESFSAYDDYYNAGQDGDAICYLTLANRLIHEVNPHAITIAEEVSGMPGLAVKPEAGGYGFDYRMAMNIPDFWIKLIKEKKDEEWFPSAIWWETTNRRADEKTISYTESHDQALVGDKTILFRLIDADMYWFMSKLTSSPYSVDRGIALHKMIRLVTATTINGGYLTFMGNEFGHPEWIDFPREGNDWSYKYARRQWTLASDQNLKYHYLGDFDKAMIALIRSQPDFQRTSLEKIWDKDDDNILAYKRDELLFVYNFHPQKSYSDYGILVPQGEYEIILDTDNKTFGGFGLNDDTIPHFTQYDPLYAPDNKGWLKLYLPARTAVVLRKKEEEKKMIYPLKFEPILKTVIWGGSEICRFKDIEPLQEGIGESWEISGVPDNVSVISNGRLAGTSLDELLKRTKEKLVGEKIYQRFGDTFPLLIKFIDARDDLSIQVHPDDTLAKVRHNSFGKTEMWYVVQANPGAYLYSGFEKSITPDEYIEKVNNNTFTDTLKKQEVKTGDLFFLPAGRVHAIGAGCFIAEIQQTSDITYRIYDYNRKDAGGNARELHTELAKDAIDFKVYDSYRTEYESNVNQPVKLVSSPYFTTHLLEMDIPMKRSYASLDSFVIYICIAGHCTISDDKGNTVFISQGESMLIPADTNSVIIIPGESSRLLETYIGE